MDILVAAVQRRLRELDGREAALFRCGKQRAGGQAEKRGHCRENEFPDPAHLPCSATGMDVAIHSPFR
ncbi:hypothetical protein [Cupriavidus sp. GA3-3]|uniref:hypothetical protein n=1 Tax=Cupriavidus sp. GA3-3 TaxID=1229514 RepID=UPI001FF06D20|nr:hypothetical protein [Cupriavidus sp. GA3-3]